MRFPSLVEAALAYREPAWRARELELELLGKPGHRRPKRGRNLPAEEVQRITNLLVSGWRVKDVCTAVNRAEKSVRRVLAKLSREQRRERDQNLNSAGAQEAAAKSVRNIVRDGAAREGNI